MVKYWNLRASSSLAPKLARETGLSDLEAQLLINRGVSDTRDAQAFLSPRLADLLDPLLLKDMDAALAMILRTLENGEEITVYGDFDTDGLTSTALLLNVFSTLDIPASFYIPDRFSEGHGLNLNAVRGIARERGGLMITVDCGTSDDREIALAIEMGLKVIVTDHHQVPENFNPLCPVINPHRPDSRFPFKNLAGVGVAFFLAVALRTALRDQRWFRDRPEPDLRPFLDLVALGTVADVVPLVGQNRILVSRGIEMMKISQWPGIQAIREITDVNPAMITAYDVAFKFAPRLNAPGRLGDAALGVKALTTHDLPLALDLAKQLDALNIKRQAIEQDILHEIEDTLLTRQNLTNRRALVFAGRGWHRGVLGIVASRLMDRYHRPVLILGIDDGMAVGSGRSIEGFNLYEALAKLEHHLEKFGGHYRAAGFTLRASNIQSLAEEMEGLAQQTLTEEHLIPSVDVDAEASLSELDERTIHRIGSLAPFGPGNPNPLFYGRAFEVLDSKIVGGKHLKLLLRQGSATREAIGFGMGERHPLDTNTIDLVYTPEINHWQGHKRVQLKIADLEEAGKGSRIRPHGA